MKIIQDTREPELQLLADVNNVDIEFKRVYLKVGDYKFKNIIIERKTIDDFIHSILDGRMESQVEKMKKSGKKCFIIIVGSLKDRKSDIHENCILGKVVSLVVKHDMKILWVEDEFQFVWVLRNLIEKIK